MTMLTRCPHCDTVFRVTPQQLQQQQGQVRCGHCMQVFDGFRTLTSEQGRSLADALPHGAESGARIAPTPGVATPEVLPTAEPAAAVTEAAIAAPPPRVPSTVADEPADEGVEAPLRERSRLYWALGSVVLLLVLLAQVAYVYRTELAAHYPALKPALARACELAGCTVPLPQRPRLISIEASDLQIPDAAEPGVIQLTATLRSHAPYDLSYPALDLVLTNAQEHTLARRIFMPREYLDRKKDPAAGIPPNAEVTLQLDLDTGTLGASGFRLDLLPAPL